MYSFGDNNNTQKKTLVNTKYVFINSMNRNNGTNSEFQVNLPANLFINTSNRPKYLKISLYNLSINREWPDIINGINNLFDFYDGATTTSIAIPEGCYSAYSLRDYLNIVLVSKYVVTYSLTTNKFTFTSSDPNATIHPYTCGQFLGLTNGLTYTGTFTSDNPLNLQYESTIYLNTDIASSSYNLDNINHLEMQTSTIIDRIPVDAPPFSNIIYNCNEKLACLEIPMLNNLTNLKFWLTTDKLRRITNLTHPYNFTLRIDVYEK